MTAIGGRASTSRAPLTGGRRSDALIATVPEVAHVFGKAGRADTATDPAPLSMFETTITLRPREQWRAGMSSARLLDELQGIVQLPGLLNSWGYPIRTRIAMLSSGVKTPLGLRITASDWRAAEQLALAAAARLRTLPGLRSATPSRGGDGDYLQLRLRQPQAAALGVDAAMLGQFAALITGPEPITYLNGDGAARFPVTLRLASHLRDDLATLGAVPLATRGGSVPLSTVATLERQRGPSEIQSEGGRAAAYVHIDIDNDDVQAFVAAASASLSTLPLPVGTALAWVGEYQDYARARQRPVLIAPLVLLTVLVLLLAVFREPRRALLVIASLPFALVGSVWLTYLLDFQFSVAVAVGMLALAGVAAEFSVIMVLYLDNAVRERGLGAHTLDAEQWRATVTAGAVQRLRPKVMTVAVISAGLLPVLWSEGAGCDVMQRIAAPMVGGMLTAPLLSMLLVPLIYHRWFCAWPPRDA